MQALNLNLRAMRIADELAGQLDVLGGSIVPSDSQARIIDLGIQQTGSLEAGRYLAKICLSDLADVSLTNGLIADRPLPQVHVNVHQPVAACLASQYAGWQIRAGKFFAMGSGPMRAAYGKEDLFDHIGHRESPESVVGILETSKLPGPEVISQIAEKCRVQPHRITLLCARTASLVGGLQIVARSVETALHKLHALGFDVRRIVAGLGSAPLPPVAADDLEAIGRTNDAVLYGASVTLMARGDDDSLAAIAEKLPASASHDYGRPFAQIFAAYQHDFYKIDPLLFSPALINLQNIDSGRSFTSGKINQEVLMHSFFEKNGPTDMIR